MARHIIHKQSVTLYMPDAASSSLFQDKISHLLRNDINDAMEAVFDKVAGNDGEVIRINRLELDLGAITRGNFEAEFKARFIEELTKVLPKAKSDAGTGETTIMGFAESVMEALQYFLRHGRLPWYAGSKQMRAWEDEIVNMFTNTEWTALGDWFQKERLLNPAVTERLILQFSDNFILAFLTGSGYSARSGDTPALIYNDLYFFINTISSGQPAALRLTAWDNLLDTVFEGYPIVKILKTILQNIAGKTQAISALFAGLRNTDWHEKLKTATIIKAVDNLLKDNSSHREKEITKAAEKGKSKSREKNISRRGQTRTFSSDDFIFVQNCGIVLLNPFLFQYFDELGLLNKKDFVDPAAQKRAVLLLHYLATGSSEAAEFDLALQKVISGLPIDEPMPNTLEFTEKEKEEAEKMLKAVTEHWTPLNNTSVEGLRTTFLQREGKIKQTDSGWKLEVETKTVDVLLGKLPWGYSTIRLPWLKDLLYVEWY